MDAKHFSTPEVSISQTLQETTGNVLSKIKESREESKKKRAAEREAKELHAATYGKCIMYLTSEDGKSSIYLKEGGIEFKSKDESLNPGEHTWDEIKEVTIEDAEEFQSRVTVTRLLLVGVFAFALKKKKGGTKYIVVEGEDFLWPIEIGRKKAADAKKFVMKARTLKKNAQ